jgi:hypothetical protein
MKILRGDIGCGNGVEEAAISFAGIDLIMFDITSNELHLVALGSKMRLIPI